MPHHSDKIPTQVEGVTTEGRLIQWASSYDFFTNFLTLGQINRLRTMTIDLALLKPGEALLDVGCGTGGVTIPASQRVGTNGSAAGIDPAPEMISVARQKSLDKGLTIDFRVGAIEALPFPDESFDVVTSSLMMHHLPEHLQVKGVAEIYRVLRPGGRLLVADFRRPNASLLSRLFTALSMHHGLKFGVEDLPEMIKEAQFGQVNVLEEKFLFIGFVRASK